MFRMVRSIAIPCPRPAPGRWAIATLALLGLLLVPATGAQAAEMSKTYGFNVFTTNGMFGETVEQYIKVTVSGEVDGDSALFTFFWEDAAKKDFADVSITAVYFDDGTLFGISEVINSTGVAFTKDGKNTKDDKHAQVNPGDLSSGNTLDPKFETTAGFSADSDPKTQPNGVNPGETLGIRFDLIDGQDIEDVIAALDAGANLKAKDDPTGTLRIGMHIQGFSDESSESAINTPNPVPGPGAVPLALSGLGAAGLFGWTRRRRRKAQA